MKSLFLAVVAAAALAFFSGNGRSADQSLDRTAEATPTIHHVFDL